MSPDFRIAAKLAPLFPRESGAAWPRFRYVFVRGGRGGSKSRGIGSYVVARMRSNRIGVLCVREIMRSIKNSSWRILKNEIERQGLNNEFVISDNEIRHINGSYCIFLGVRNNTDEIKGTEGITLLWGDEATPFSAYSLDIIRPTIARNTGAMAIFSYNPELTDDPIHMMANNPPEGSIVIDISLEDNPWATEDLYAERDRDYATDPDKAAWIWGGKCMSRSNAQVFGGRWRVEEFAVRPEWDGPYLGLDFGFAQDPNHGVAAWLHGDSIYISHEIYGLGVEIDDLPGLLMGLPQFDKRPIRCDSSRPETISYLTRHGFPHAKGAKKWPGSIEDGVTWLRGHQIVIHFRCEKLAEQARLYSHKIDSRTNDILPDIVDANNHGWDALRYAVEPMIFGMSEGPASKPGPVPRATRMW